MSRRDNQIVGLDIGTTKICAIVAERRGDAVEVIGVGVAPCEGLRKGVVVNIEATVGSIRKAVEEAESVAACEIDGAYIGIAGGHIKAINCHGAIPLKSGEVRPLDVQRVIEAATTVAIPIDREVIHTIPQEFVIDGEEGIRDPVGMNGGVLEAWVHIVTGAVSAAQNLVKCANKAGLTVHDIVLQPLASAEAVLTKDEKELGVALIDIGGGTSDLAIFADGAIKHSSVLQLAGSQITGDVALGLRTPVSEAERLKLNYGCALASMVNDDEVIEVPSLGGRRPRVISRHALAEIIEMRVDETLQLVEKEIKKAGLADAIASGIVLTGGTANLVGLPELAERIFDLPVRRGAPREIGGLGEVVSSPKYATGVGLVLTGARNGRESKFRIRDENIFSRVTMRMKEWFQEALV